MLLDKDQKRKESPCLEKSNNSDPEKTYKNTNLKLQDFFLHILSQKQTLPLAICVLSREPEPIVYITSAFLEEVSFTDYVDSGKRQHRFRHIS